jgi:hypothetical protein
MNPARAFGPYLARGDFTHYWIYVVGPIAGMLLGAAAFRYTHAVGRVASAEQDAGPTTAAAPPAREERRS